MGSDSSKGKLVATIKEDALSFFVPEPPLIAKFPKISKEHLTVLLGLSYHGNLGQPESTMTQALFKLCQGYQNGALVVEKDGDTYKLLEKLQ